MITIVVIKMTLKDNLENIDKALKFTETEKDKADIQKVLGTYKNFHNESNRVYNKFLLKRDYLKYFYNLKLMNKMTGAISFKDLNVDEKKQVLKLMMDAIDCYKAELEMKDEEI